MFLQLEKIEKVGSRVVSLKFKISYLLAATSRPPKSVSLLLARPRSENQAMLAKLSLLEMVFSRRGTDKCNKVDQEEPGTGEV